MSRIHALHMLSPEASLLRVRHPNNRVCGLTDCGLTRPRDPAGERLLAVD